MYLKKQKKILIIGSNGAGKSTFAIKLGKYLGFKVHHLDKIYWFKGWKHSSKIEFEEKVGKILKSQHTYILDGDYFFNLEERLKYADLVIWIKIPVVMCIINIIKRKIKYGRRTRPDITDECYERLKLTFLIYTAKYNNRSGRQTKELLNKVYNEDVFIIDSYRKLKNIVKSYRNSELYSY